MLNYESTKNGLLIFDDNGKVHFIIEPNPSYCAAMDSTVRTDKNWQLVRVESVEPFRQGGNNGLLPIETIGTFNSIEAAKYCALSNYLES